MGSAASKEIKIHKLISTTLDISKKYLVAVSGGVDSVVLAVAMKKLNYNFLAITIDHNLRPNSKTDAKFTKEYLASLGIECLIKTWHGKIEKNLEQEAREARYSIFQQIADDNNIHEIITAHHLDDQVETFFMNLLRGSGLDGLCCMPITKNISNKTKLTRPMLSISKLEILNYAQEKSLKWVEDETNEDEKFTRNKIRKIISSFEDFQEFKPRIANAIMHLQGVKQVVDEILEEEFKNVYLETCEGAFKKEWFLNLNREIQFGILKKIILHFADKKPRFSSLQTLHSLIISGEIKRITTSNLLVSVRKKEVFFKVWG